MTPLQKVIKYCAVAFAVFLIVSIIGGICGAVYSMSFLFDEDAEGEIQTYAVSSDVENLEIDISAAALKIVNGETFSVESNHKYLTVREKGDTLVISESRPLFGMSSGGISVVLTVPEGFVFDKADISAGAGKVETDTLSANKLRMELGAGAAEIECLNVLSNGKINGGTGKLTICGGELYNTDMDIGVGKLEMTGTLEGDCSLDYGVGSVDLVLLGSREDYRIKIDKGIGGALLSGRTMEDDCVYGNGKNLIDIDGGVGSINIDFRER